jgi:hypothetical protein
MRQFEKATYRVTEREVSAMIHQFDQSNFVSRAACTMERCLT